MIVQNSQDECHPFDSRVIVQTLLRETDVNKDDATKIARAVERKVKGIKDRTIMSAEIREEVNAQLRKRGFTEEARQHERIGIPAAEIKNLIQNHNTDNANMQRNPETFHKYVADAALKQYALMSLPKRMADAHINGTLHQHDLEFFPGRPINCLNHDLRWFIKEDVKLDGTGEHTSVATPARRMETLMNHCGEILLAGQQNCSGGQSFNLWNVFVAPFARGLTYQEIKQNVQMFVYNLNMAYSNRGGQVPFTSIGLEFTVPDFLKNEPAYGPGGKIVGVYGDYEEETRQIQRAFVEIMMQGDATGKPHLFPNSIWAIREEMLKPEFEDDLLKVHELSAKFSTPYFANMVPDWTGHHSNVMGCRTRLNTNWTGDWEKDTLRTGNLAYVTLNLPRIAYKTDNLDDYKKELNRVLNIGKDILLLRRKHAVKCLDEYNLLPFLSQTNNDGERYYRIENATLSFGFVGLNETVKAMGYEDGLESDEGKAIAEEILTEITQFTKKASNETGFRWTIIQTPGESTCHRFAMIDKEKYPDKAIVNGEPGSYYYTNSSHIAVDSEISLGKRITQEESFHPIASGGHILNIYIGEDKSDAKGLMALTKKIVKNTNVGFWAYTTAFSYCFDCSHFIYGLQEKCDQCGSTDGIEWFSRVTGYIQQVGHKKDSAGGWNPGKKQELVDRHQYKVG